jgi:hypothetical protein
VSAHAAGGYPSHIRDAADDLDVQIVTPPFPAPDPLDGDALMDMLSHTRKPAGVSRQLTTFDLTTRSKTRMIRPGERVTIGDVSGAGYLSRLWITFPGWFWPHWHPSGAIDVSLLKALIMRIYWDDADTPAVEAPVGDFFGAGHCEFNSFAARYVGTSSGGFYCCWPMPYSTGFRIEFENRHPTMGTDLFLNANYQELDAPVAGAGYFCGQFHTGRRGPADGAVVLEAEGSGHFVGMMLHMQGELMHYLSFLEAPEYVYIDDDWETPRFTGTGLEDYFSGGWYFRDGEFTGPLHGVPLKDPLRSMVTMYRFHEADAIGFDRRIKLTFENPWEVERLKPYWYSSVAYWYAGQPGPPQRRLPSHRQVMQLYRTRDTDHLSIP